MQDYVPTFDIFSGMADRDAVWLEAVKGLAEANRRMKERALQKAGAYFVFDARSHQVLASINTSAKTGGQSYKNSRIA